jgi:hypothetical protein
MINQLSIHEACQRKLAENSTVSEVVKKDGGSLLQETVQEISDWTNLNRFQLNSTKCEEMTSFKKQPCVYKLIHNISSGTRTSRTKLLSVSIC